MSVDIINHLNILLKNEITSITQYILHAEMFKYQGYYKLAEKEEHEIPDEIGHAKKLTARILFLKGVPEFKGIGDISITDDPKAMLQADLKLETQGIGDLKSAISFIDSADDYITSNILQDMLKNEEEHQNWLRLQLDLMEKIGIDLYLQDQMKKTQSHHCVSCATTLKYKNHGDLGPS